MVSVEKDELLLSQNDERGVAQLDQFGSGKCPAPEGNLAVALKGRRIAYCEVKSEIRQHVRELIERSNGAQYAERS